MPRRRLRTLRARVQCGESDLLNVLNSQTSGTTMSDPFNASRLWRTIPLLLAAGAFSPAQAQVSLDVRDAYYHGPSSFQVPACITASWTATGLDPSWYSRHASLYFSLDNALTSKYPYAPSGQFRISFPSDLERPSTLTVCLDPNRSDTCRAFKLIARFSESPPC